MKTVYTLVILVVLTASLPLSGFATRYDVEVMEFEFANSPAVVNVGDTIRWIWVNGSHTTTSTSVPAGAAEWDHLINASSTEFEYVVTAAGVYSYVCTPHSSMMAAMFTGVGTMDAATPTALENIFAVKIERNDFVTVTYAVAQSAPVSIGLYDLTGKLLKTTPSQTQVRGVYDYNMPIHDVKTGMYFVVVQIGSERKTSKFTVR